MTPTEVLLDLKLHGDRADLNLAQVISACGGFVSGAQLRTVIDGREWCRNIGGHSYAQSERTGDLMVWPEPTPLTADFYLEVRKYVAWAQATYHPRCASCGSERYHQLTEQLHPGANLGAARNRLPLCSECRHTLAWDHRDPHLMVIGEVSPEPGQLAFIGPAGDRLREMLGVDTQRFYRDVIAINLLPSPLAIRPSRVSRRTFARLHGMAIEPVVTPGNMPIIVFGRGAALGLPAVTPTPHQLHGFDVSIMGLQRVICVPHPSGRCHYWNDPNNRARLKALFDELTLAH